MTSATTADLLAEILTRDLPTKTHECQPPDRGVPWHSTLIQRKKQSINQSITEWQVM
jgi:hypothetical protein